MNFQWHRGRQDHPVFSGIVHVLAENPNPGRGQKPRMPGRMRCPVAPLRMVKGHRWLWGGGAAV